MGRETTHFCVPARVDSLPGGGGSGPIFGSCTPAPSSDHCLCCLSRGETHPIRAAVVLCSSPRSAAEHLPPQRRQAAAHRAVQHTVTHPHPPTPPNRPTLPALPP